MTHHRHKKKYRLKTVHTIRPAETEGLKEILTPGKVVFAPTSEKETFSFQSGIFLEESPTGGKVAYYPAREIQDFSKPDQGQHYRFSATFPVFESDFMRGRLTVQLDPFKIAEVYGMTDFALMTILKKTLCAGNRGHKNLETDLRDIICAAERRLEMIEETKLTGETL